MNHTMEQVTNDDAHDDIWNLLAELLQTPPLTLKEPGQTLKYQVQSSEPQIICPAWWGQLSQLCTIIPLQKWNLSLIQSSDP
jgi:hypothetical protein